MKRIVLALILLAGFARHADAQDAQQAKVAQIAKVMTDSMTRQLSLSEQQ